MFFTDSRKLQMPSAADALPGRDTPIPQRAVEEPRRKGAWLWGIVAFLLVLGIGYGAFLFFNPDARTETVAVPAVIDQRSEAAQQTLLENKLQVVVKEVVGADDDTVGRVIGQDPPAGVKVPVNSTVTIQVNVGPKKATIPNDLVGKSLTDATKALKDLDFSNVKTKVDTTSTAKARRPSMSGR